MYFYIINKKDHFTRTISMSKKKKKKELIDGIW